MTKQSIWPKPKTRSNGSVFVSEAVDITAIEEFVGRLWSRARDLEDDAATAMRQAKQSLRADEDPETARHHLATAQRATEKARHEYVLAEELIQLASKHLRGHWEPKGRKR